MAYHSRTRSANIVVSQEVSGIDNDQSKSTLEMIQAKIKAAANKQNLNEELVTDMSHVEEEEPREDQENYGQEFKTEDEDDEVN